MFLCTSQVLRSRENITIVSAFFGKLSFKVIMKLKKILLKKLHCGSANGHQWTRFSQGQHFIHPTLYRDLPIFIFKTPTGVNFTNIFAQLFLVNKMGSFFCQMSFSDWRTDLANGKPNLACKWGFQHLKLRAVFFRQKPCRRLFTWVTMLGETDPWSKKEKVKSSNKI